MSTNVNIRTYDNKLYAGMTFKQVEQTGDKKLIKNFKLVDKNADGIISKEEIRRIKRTNSKTSVKKKEKINYLYLGISLFSGVVALLSLKQSLKSPNKEEELFFDFLDILCAGTCIGTIWSFFSNSGNKENSKNLNNENILQDKEKVLGQKLDKMSE